MSHHLFTPLNLARLILERELLHHLEPTAPLFVHSLSPLGPALFLRERLVLHHLELAGLQYAHL